MDNCSEMHSLHEQSKESDNGTRRIRYNEGEVVGAEGAAAVDHEQKNMLPEEVAPAV